jgi:hypothetical protein
MSKLEKYLKEEKSLEGQIKNIENVVKAARIYQKAVKKYEADTAVFSKWVQKALTRTVQNDNWYTLEDGYAELVGMGYNLHSTLRRMEDAIASIKRQV